MVTADERVMDGATTEVAGAKEAAAEYSESMSAKERRRN